MTSKKAQEVMEWINAYTEGVDKQPQHITTSFYNNAIHYFKTEEERQAFHLGCVAAVAEARGNKVKSKIYGFKYRKALSGL